MKKIIKLFLCLSLAFVILFAPLKSFANAYAEENEVTTNNEANDILIMPQEVSDIFEIKDTVSFDKEKVFEIFSDFQNKYPNRASGTDAEKECAKGLSNFLSDWGYSEYKGKYISEFSKIGKDSDGTSFLTYSQNVAGIKYAKKATDKQIIIGAHYDNAYTKDINCEGAYDNGSGVASVMAMAEFVAKTDLDVNVVIVFFGMEELGVYGSADFVSKMSQTEIDNTLLMINFDSVACGDYLYLFSDEAPRTHENIFFDTATKVNFDLQKMPYDKKANGNFRSFTKPFTHIGLQSDNSYFVEAKIPSASFVGYNLITKENINGHESDGKVDIMHTANDTLSNIIDIYGKDTIKNRMGGLLDLVATTILRSDFISEMEYSKANPTVTDIFYQDWFIYSVIGFFFAAFIIAVVLVFLKLKKTEVIDENSGDKKNDAFDEKNDNDQNTKDDDDDDKDVFDL